MPGSAAPGSVELLALAVQRGHRPTTVTSLLTGMLDDYGASELACAIDAALQQQAPHPNAVRQVLERRRDQRNNRTGVPWSGSGTVKHLLHRVTDILYRIKAPVKH